MRELHLFTAAWSTPGLLMAPMLKRIAADYSLDFYQHDAAADLSLVGRYGLRTLPTVLLTEGGAVLRRWVGFQAEYRLRRDLAQHS